MQAGPRIFAFIAVVCAVSAGAVGCSPEIGDDCETALDCSSQGSRLCDRTQPGGYCTIRGCERGTCPEEAVCVKFRPAVERLAVTYCMYSCSDDSDCRDARGYRCLSDDAFGNGMDAELLDNRNKKFCALRDDPPSVTDGPDATDAADAGMSELPPDGTDAGIR